MMRRVVIPPWLALYAVPVDWGQTVRNWPPSLARLELEQLKLNASVQGGLLRSIQLRWMCQPGLGLPRESFKVFRRLSHLPKLKSIDSPTPLQLSTGALRSLTLGGDSMAVVEIDCQLAAGQSIQALAYDGQGRILDSASTSTAGYQVLRLRSDSIYTVALLGSAAVTAVKGVSANDYANLPDWQLVETVGLPVDASGWAGTGYSLAQQGPVSAPLNPYDAALRRLKIGGPLLGWLPVTDTGIPVTPWKPPVFHGFLTELDKTVLPPVIAMLKSTVGMDPSVQANYQSTQNLPPPASVGASPGAGSSQASVPALPQMLMAASSDPFSSLALGFGTALAPVTGAVSTNVIDSVQSAFPGGDNCDYMVSVNHTIFGVHIELADFVIAPRNVPLPNTVINLSSTLKGRNPPQIMDGAWSESCLLSWTRVLQPYFTSPRIASYAAARDNPGAAISNIMLAPRNSGGWSPLVPSRQDDDPQGDWVRFVDTELPHPSNINQRTFHYSIAVQDLFGRYSAWKSVDYNFHDDPVEVPAIVSQQLLVTGGIGNSRDATLSLDLAWDWTTRSPKYIELVGTLLTSTPHTPDPSAAPGTGLQLALSGGPGTTLQIDFTGDIPNQPTGVSVQCLDENRENIVTCGSAQSAVRYYRVTVPGFTLDFTGTSEVSLVLYARGVENLPPSLPGPWSAPSVARVASPVPPPAVTPPLDMQWASSPDVAGVSRARLSWNDVGAFGYAIYTATETGMLDAAGLASADLTQPFLNRLATLRALNFTQLRSAFMRLQDSLVTGTVYEVDLPRGSKVIHGFVVVPVSAAQVDADWPGSFYAVAVPHLSVPAESTLELRSGIDTSGHTPIPVVRATVLTRKGAPVAKVELYRASNNAIAQTLENMGPPISSSDSAGWTLLPDPVTAAGISRADYVDMSVTPGWKTLWYRAVVWSADSPGEIGTRSSPSPAMKILLPPPGPPDASDLKVRESGSTATQILVSWLCAAPIPSTQLGPHRIVVRVKDPSGGNQEAVLRFGANLDQTERVPDDLHRPLALNQGGPIFRELVSGVERLFAWVPRPVRTNGSTDSFTVAVTISDPLGRSTQLSGEGTWT